MLENDQLEDQRGAFILEYKDVGKDSSWKGLMASLTLDAEY